MSNWLASQSFCYSSMSLHPVWMCKGIQTTFILNGDLDEGLDSDEHEGDAADLGAEDGEEPWDEDDLHVEGYDEL